MKTVSINNNDDVYNRMNLKASGQSDWDTPSVRYVHQAFKVPTVGELKKITGDYVVSLGYDRPNIINISDYWRAYENEQSWRSVHRTPSSKYPGEDVIVAYSFTYYKQSDGSWKATQKRLNYIFVKNSVSNAKALAIIKNSKK